MWVFEYNLYRKARSLVYFDCSLKKILATFLLICFHEAPTYIIICHRASRRLVISCGTCREYHRCQRSPLLLQGLEFESWEMDSACLVIDWLKLVFMLADWFWGVCGLFYCIPNIFGRKRDVPILELGYTY